MNLSQAAFVFIMTLCTEAPSLCALALMGHKTYKAKKKNGANETELKMCVCFYHFGVLECMMIYSNSLSKSMKFQLYFQIGPEKGVVHLAVAAVINALWDLWAKIEGKVSTTREIDFPEYCKFVK